MYRDCEEEADPHIEYAWTGRGKKAVKARRERCVFFFVLEGHTLFKAGAQDEERKEGKNQLNTDPVALLCCLLWVCACKVNVFILIYLKLLRHIHLRPLQCRISTKRMEGNGSGGTDGEGIAGHI
jgi:hypothetical protein